MCFSATASFTAAGLLLVAGASTWRLADRGFQKPLAAVPLLFGAQQAVEGFVWIGLGTGSPGFTSALAWIYSLFSHVLWPAYVPLAVWLAEPLPARRRALLAASAGGLVFSIWLLHGLLADPPVASAVGRHVAYDARDPHGPVVMALYLAATAGSLALSSHAFLRRFGLAVSVSLVLAWLLYSRWLFSTWCFFAAILSLGIWAHFVGVRWRRREITAI